MESDLEKSKLTLVILRFRKVASSANLLAACMNQGQNTVYKCVSNVRRIYSLKHALQDRRAWVINSS